MSNKFRANLKKISLAMILIFIASLALASAPRFSRVVEEIGKGSSSALLTRMIFSTLKKLPGWMKTKSKARKIANKLPSFPETVPSPTNERIFSWIKDLASFPHRRPGSPEDLKAEEYLISQLKKLGIKNITKEEIPIKYWQAEKWSLKVETDSGFKPFPCFYVPYTGFTPEQGITAEMVYVGVGRAKDFARKKVKGKIVVAEVPFPSLPYGLMLRLLPVYYFSDPEKSVGLGFKEPLIFVRRNFLGYFTEENHPKDDVYWQAVERGAVGILLILKDQPTNSNTHYGPYDGILKPLPGFWIGKYDGEKLKELAKKGRKAKIILRGKIQNSVSHNIYGILPGKSERMIIIHSHHDSPFKGAVEDGAGCAQVLAQAWSWSKLPKEKRPKTLLFLFTTGHFYGSIGSDTFAQKHKNDLLKKADVIFTLEHIGAREAIEGKDRNYQFTGYLEIGGIFASPQTYTIASAVKMLSQHKLPRTSLIPVDFMGPAPPTDASGFVLEDLSVPILSWITGPAYLLCAEDTLDKIDRSQLAKFSRAITDLVGTLMMIESEKLKL